MCRIGYIERGREILASDVQDEPVLEANHFIAHKMEYGISRSQASQSTRCCVCALSSQSNRMRATTFLPPFVVIGYRDTIGTDN